ncbi:g-protein alpha subunit domain-containing protein [Ditylenchus destructor]|nr:g-protein alpha subunit domain-containing protein [Ditylenchus destructor]
MGNCEGFVHKLTAVSGNNRNDGHDSPASSANTARQMLGGGNHGANVIRVEPGRNPQAATLGDTDNSLKERPISGNNNRISFPSPNSVVPSMQTNAAVNTRATEISRKIDEELFAENKAMDKVIKLLLLGPSESGKSTVLKQMRIIHLNGFSMDELWARRPLIYLNLVQSMVQLLNGLRRFGVKLSIEREIDANIILSLSQHDPQLANRLPERVYFALKRLWSDEKIQYIHEERRSEFYLMDCAKYFLDDLDRIYEMDYVPTITDILFARMETIGVTEIRYHYKNMEFRIFDVGGQKTERRKWIHIFDNVNSIFFIAAISEYDQMMREDQDTNRLHDAIELFRNIGNNPLFAKVQIILFLNKKDLFSEKITRVPLTACFPNYRYKNDYKNAAIYITKKFEQQIRDKQKMVYTHLCCATDTDHIQFVTNSVTDMIIAENFKQTGIF